MNVGIIGAGPSGAYCGLRILTLARERGLDCTVHLFDPKSFDRTGPQGCNFCAGLISVQVVDRFKADGVDLEKGGYLQRTIRGFKLVTAGGSEKFYAPRGNNLFSVFRGGGPAKSDPETNPSFDRLLLSRTVEAGAIHHPHQVTAISRRTGPSGFTWDLGTSDGQISNVDMLVGAFGVNSEVGSLFEGLGFGYQRPECESTLQAEFELDEKFIHQTYRNLVILFNIGMKQVRFAALVPKRNYVSMTVIGDQPSWATVTWLLRRPDVRMYLPHASSKQGFSCMCKPMMPVGAAKNPVGDHVMVIGDAHICRYYKNGIGSAFFSAEHAARAIISGTNRQTLRNLYLAPTRKLFCRDNKIGHGLFRLNDWIARSDFHSSVQLECASQTSTRGGKILNRALWGLFTGETPYAMILLRLLHPACLAQMSWRYLARGLPGSRRIRCRIGPLVNGGKVAIIGGGVGGSCAALSLLREAKRRGIDIRILLVEPKSFGTQYNQCLGVLTPPLLEILEHDLGVTIHESMIRRVVSGYHLRTENGMVDLESTESEARTVTVRRVELDRYLLDLAESKGVRVIQSRVTGIEIHPEAVILFTDSGTDSADVVIGAFGLDDSMQRVFEKEVGYIPPKSLNTIVTKVHPADQQMIDDFQGRIESFLVPVPGSSFGAIVPKKDHLSIVLAGRNVTTRHMLQFLELPQVKTILNFDHELDFAFRGAFPNGPAKKFYGNRYAMVGDATGLVRPFKGKGINSAAITGIRVAETIINEGISEDSFSNYARRCEGLAGGVRTGQLVQFIAHLLGRTLGFGPMVDFASTSEDFREALYGAVSGTMSYGKVLKITLKPAILIGLAGVYLGALRSS